MTVWDKYLGWGYGFFSYSAGEHLNKRIKFIETEETNMDDNHFQTVIRNHRLKQLHYQDSYVLGAVTVVTCLARNIQGNNKKNKSCPMHSSQPSLTLHDSDIEE